MKLTQVCDSELAKAIYALASTGFSGSVSELALAVGLGKLAPTAAGQFASTVKTLAKELADLKVEITFVAKGNNKTVTISKGKGFRKQPPLFSSTAVETKTELDPTDKRVHKLESDNLHLKNELRLTKAAYAAANRDNGLFASVVDVLEGRIQSMTPLPRAPVVPRTRDVIDEHLVMHISDGHHDQIVLPHEVQNLENYNFWVSCRRAETYVDTVIKWSQQTLSNFRFNGLTILAYGDHTSGEIHDAVQRSTFRNQFTNCLAIGQLHAAMYRDLAPYFPHINIVYVPGNHGRRTAKKEYSGPKNNWDYMVAEVARMYCRQIPNISFVIPDSFAINVDIEGIGFHVSHGDDVAGAGGVPWYGLQRRASRLMALNHAASKSARVRYFVCGHYHKPATVGDMDGELLANGPWLATDSYCYNRFSGFTEPTQLLHGVSAKRGVTWRLPVQLRTADDHEGPKRYKIEMANETGALADYGAGD